MAFHVQVKGPNDKRFRLLAPQGRVTALRIHASVFPTKEGADAAATAVAEDNPGWQAKVREVR